MFVKRVAILSVHTSPLAPMGGKKTGGMNVYIRELSQELGKLGIAVDIFTRKTSLDEPDIDESSLGDNVRVVTLAAGPISTLAPEAIMPHLSQFTARVIAFATLKGIRYDIIYSHYWLSGWVAHKLKEAWGVPFVQMFHTLGQMKNRIVPERVSMLDERISVELQLMDWADRIIAATPAEQAQLLWLYRAKRRKITIIPPGVNLDRFQPLSQKEARACLGFDVDSKVLLFVGRIEPLKGLDTIIDALKVVSQQEPNLLDKLSFAVVGGDPDDPTDEEMQRLKSLVREKGLENIVTFYGAKEQTQLPIYYTAATAVLMPSDYESFGMVALEAMASGTPVIATQTGGLAFLVRNEETGYLIPVRESVQLADRIKELMTDMQKIKEMGQTASHLARDYAWSRIAVRILDLFETVIEDNAATNRRKR